MVQFPAAAVHVRRFLLVTAAIAIVAAVSLLAPAEPAGAAEVCAEPECDTVAFVDAQATFDLYGNLAGSSGVGTFTYGNPADEPLMGDWDCDGDQTPAMYRRSQGFMYLRNSNSQGVADLNFHFGNPGDVPLAGDFNGDGCDSLSIYRPSEGEVYVSNTLRSGRADYSYYFGNPGDKPFVGDFDGDGVDTVGLHRRSTGLVYFRNTNDAGVAHRSFVFGDPNDVVFAGDWDGDGDDTVAAYRSSNGTLYLKNRHVAGFADHQLTVGSYPYAVPASGISHSSSGGAGSPQTFTDGFEGAAAGWPQSATVGHWQVVYDSYGYVGLTGDGSLGIAPQAANRRYQTYGALVTSTQSYSGDIDITVRLQTAYQLRTGSPPNPWEVGWLVWNYTHDHRFYYVLLKPNGWELGRIDNTKLDPSGPECLWPEYENCKYPEAQRFLSLANSPTFAVGEWHDIRISQSGNDIVVWADGRELTRATDPEDPYRYGHVGLYTEDAQVFFDSITVTGFPD